MSMPHQQIFESFSEDKPDDDDWKDEFIQFFANMPDKFVFDTSTEEDDLSSARSSESFHSLALPKNEAHGFAAPIIDLQLAHPALSVHQSLMAVNSDMSQGPTTPKALCDLSTKQLVNAAIMAKRKESGHKSKVNKGSKRLKSSASADPGRDPVEDKICSRLNSHRDIIVQLLEEKAYQLIDDHSKDREAELQNQLLKIESPDSLEAIPTDEDALKYFANIVLAFNRGTTTGLEAAFRPILAPNCVYRSHVICPPGQEKKPFSDKVIQSAEIVNLYKGILESFPDSFWKLKGSKILTNNSQGRKSVLGYFSFSATMLRDVYEAEIAKKYSANDDTHTKAFSALQSTVQSVATTGVYVLTLNEQMLVRHFEVIFVADVMDKVCQ